MTDDGKRVSEAMPDPASTKQTTADLERWRKANGITGPREDNRLAFYVAHLKGGPCLNPTCATCIEISDALERLNNDNKRLRGVLERAKDCASNGAVHLKWTPLDVAEYILDGDANAGGGE